jgi:hypothetical protein
MLMDDRLTENHQLYREFWLSAAQGGESWQSQLKQITPPGLLRGNHTTLCSIGRQIRQQNV